ncbi:hypothetical protein CMV30_11365 [Nibricoccus aquaticus]|uniref:Peptidase n=1 Tax=Nibricoccus aquaticus TaxID=2576891 RepID=A0A290QKU2_9BACT|nr:PepSY domain-containing protein [Nibricoccus aquaticus]ATC64502.1 hypothetical protein CMV30_11365 [Nibricoccus aquaticus]
MSSSNAPARSDAPLENRESKIENAGALYRAAWRWHFYAGILAAPLAIFLAVTGTLYLWKPQYEAWRYRDLREVPIQTSAASIDDQYAAALAAYPDAKPVTFTPAFEPGRTSELVVRLSGKTSATHDAPMPIWAGERATVFINPHTATVVGTLAERDRVMNTIHDLHGELLAGKAGRVIVELGASWLFVLILTGIYLWWPRPHFSVWGFLLPRLRAKGRVFWRDLHAVPAVWLSAGTLFLLSSGIPWTNVGGTWFRTVSAALGEGSPKESSASAHRSELTGWAPPLKAGHAEKIDALASTPPAMDNLHADHREPFSPESKIDNPKSKILLPRLTLARAMEIADANQVPRPYSLALPSSPTGVLSAMTDRNRAFTRAYLHLDQYSGRVLADVRYDDFGFMGKFVLWGIIAHEGQLFGVINQIANTLVCLGIITIAATGLALWWRRRPAGQLAAPTSTASLPKPVFFGTLALAVFLPLLAASLAVLVIGDLIFSKFLPWLRPRAS